MVDEGCWSACELVLAAYRTQLFNPADLDKVKEVQAGYKVQTLSAFLGQPAPVAAAAIDFIKPLTPAAQRSSLQFFEILNFVLQFCPTHPSERELMARFARIGVGGGQTFDEGQLAAELKSAIEAGMADAWAELAKLQARIDAKEVTSGDMFGTRDFLQNNYLYRMAAAVLGIYGNSQQEAMYPIYSVDADGGLTLLIQHESPGSDKEANWLPAPQGPFFMVMRLYWPKAEALDGKWIEPSLQRMP